MVELKAPVVAFFYFVVRKHTGFDKINFMVFVKRQPNSLFS